MLLEGNNMCKAINTTLANLDVSQLDAIAIFYDADGENPKEKGNKMVPEPTRDW